MSAELRRTSATPAAVWLRWLLAWLTLASLALPSAAAQADEIAPGVLILFSNQRPTPAQVVIEDALRTALTDGGKRQVQLFSEYLDDEWTTLEAYGAKQADFLRAKYEPRNVKVIVAVAYPALQFTVRFHNQIVAGAPVVHTTVARDRVDPSTLPPGIVGNFEDNDPLPTLQLALRLHPGTERIVVVRGGVDRASQWEPRLRAAIAKLPSEIQVDQIEGLATPDVLRRVAALRRGTVIFTPGYFVDGAGQVTTPRQVTERIAAASAVPVYGAFDTMIGAGIVGGYMTPYEAQAREAGAIINRLLNGTPATAIAPATVRRVPMVDWRQIHRWRVNEDLLPAGTIVAFREPSAFEQHRNQIYVALAVLLLQTALIGALLWQRSARRNTAVALEESQRQVTLATKAARLSFWTWAVFGPGSQKKSTDQSIESSSHEPTAFSDVMQSVHPADRERLQQAAYRALDAEEELDLEYRVVGRGGGVRWIAARGRAQPDLPDQLVGVALDITERKANELSVEQDRAALRQLSRVSMVGQLSAAIAHQLNQPLAAIMGNAEAAQKMLGREQVDMQELREICRDIVSEDHRASEVIRRLRELYYRADVKTGPVNLNQLVHETLGLLRTELQLRHVTVTTELDPNLPVIEGSLVQLQQVLMNLILNATEALSGIESERTLVVRTESVAGKARLSVTDNGPGIRSDQLQRVFDPFWSSKPNGMGMGLAICQSIIAAHQGRISAMNNTDQGATFVVELPLREASA